MCCNSELLGAQLYCNEVCRNGLVSVTIHLLYRGSGVQLGMLLSKGTGSQYSYCIVTWWFWKNGLYYSRFGKGCIVKPKCIVT